MLGKNLVLVISYLCSLGQTIVYFCDKMVGLDSLKIGFFGLTIFDL